MSLAERSGRRDLLYSGWHRPASINRYIPDALARILKTCDIDFCEACHWCSMPLALIETQRSNAAPKSAAVTTRLAFLAGIPAFSMSYIATPNGEDIERFRVQQIYRPGRSGHSPVADMTPGEWAEFLVRLRWEHDRESFDCAEKSAGIRALT